MKEICLRCKIQILLEENGDITKKILIKLKEKRRKMMKKKLKWKKEMLENLLMEIISKIGTIKKAKVHIETLKEE